jgi:adenylylsulfate reductase, subunit B
MPPIIDDVKCKPCGICADICPTSVFDTEALKETPAVLYPDECWHCNSCVLDCPQEAISLRIPLTAMMLYVDAPEEAGYES